MEEITCDICVIGAGSGGLSVAAGAAQMGADTVLIEGAEMGGDCLNHGCVPSKSLLAVAKQAHLMRNPPVPGVAAADPQIDYAAAKDHVARVIETIAPVDSQERFEGLGVRVLRGWASFEDEKTVVTDAHRVRARRFVIATGSSPFVPPIDGIGDVPYLTNETLFALRDRPEHLLIIGGGPIGLEMAQAHARLGSRVTVIEADRALPRDDREQVEIVLAQLASEGVQVLEGQKVTRVRHSDGVIRIETEGGTYEGSHLLVAAGRRINLDRLDLDRAGIAHDRGVTVGTDLRSPSNRRVYAIGDAAGGAQFTHVAGYHAGIVVRSAVLGMTWSKARTDHIPHVTYTDPELAHVGMTEAETREKFGGRTKVLRFNYAENDRAIATGRTTGFVKLVVANGRPCGASIIGSDAGDLIAIWSEAIANGTKLSAIANTVLPYPTLSEINKRAAGAYFAPQLFENASVKSVVRLVQKYLP
ncbi:dihydrolipoyl dehydrogenase family protein [Palleronia sp. LCG004]|uniref:dihydrolipoyl dehydrogenase family protein n=1 Tax=Palleronia sp. LCG004 TaxID=3079304 RepID=UPI00294243D5|nr:FAD-dependent oxidoreductase [Palleronia sp. LCG004]WOI56549.1 FAD-dependent oxidoreductase [Palleronia sp. LCG004]